MENFLPIIIGVAWLVYTIYSKGKKRGANRSHPEDTEKAPTPSFLEQLFTDKEELSPQPYQVYNEAEAYEPIEKYEEVVFEQEEELTPFLRAELADFEHEGQTAISPLENYLTEEDTDENNQVERPDFDLRRAIIFSEILNAPYIGYK
jgi:hypothetical protein